MTATGPRARLAVVVAVAAGLTGCAQIRAAAAHILPASKGDVQSVIHEAQTTRYRNVCHGRSGHRYCHEERRVIPAHWHVAFHDSTRKGRQDGSEDITDSAVVASCTGSLSPEGVPTVHLYWNGSRCVTK